MVQTNPFTIENIAPCTYFVVSGLVYLSIVMYMFYSKRKVKTVENFCYSVALWLTISAAVEDLLRLILPIWIKSDLLFNILNKLHIMLIIFILCVLSAYTLALTSKKYQGRIDFNQNKYKTYFKKWLYVFLGIGFVISTVFFFIKSDVGRHTYLFAGERIYSYLLIVIGAFIGLWAILMLKNFNKDARKRYAPLIGLIILLLVGSSCNRIFERMLPSTFSGVYSIVAAIIFAEIFMYFSMENPDIIVINELNEAKEKASEANSDKTKFLSTMSHEIRTPLNAIVGLSEDIQELEGLPDGAREDAKDIVMASQTLLEIVGNILDISKIESDKIEITESEYHPREIIENLARIDAVRIGDKPIDFKLHLAADLPYELIGDKVHVKQIINNLISNSIKYTNEGEINLTINCINKGDNCDLIITCQDTGIGIKEEYISKLFGKFERLGVEKNTTVEGTGLGLAITKKLIEMMGGKINVQSTYGKGSLFVVFLPQKISKLIDTQKVNTDGPIIIPKVVPEVDYSTKRILVVDDNALNIKVARKSLAPLNCNIDEATTGMKCIEKVKNGEKYDVILLDIMMPGLSGSETLKELKNIPGFSIPVIALTADAIQGAKEKYISEGFNDYIAKPFSKEQIKEKLDLIFK